MNPNCLAVHSLGVAVRVWRSQMTRPADDGISRRALLRCAGATALGAATAGAATGCASLPHAGEQPGRHRCIHIYCRYYRAPAGGQGRGLCALAIREKGDPR